MARVVLAASTFTGVALGAEPQTFWTLSDVDQDCSATCAKQNLNCIPVGWPKSLMDVFHVAGATSVTCKTVYRLNEQDVEKGASFTPSTSGSSEGVCYYPDVLGAVSCDYAYTDGRHRFCPCGDDPITFSVGDLGKSCADHCESLGGQCIHDDGQWPTDQKATEDLASKLGMTCVNTNNGTLPGISGDECDFTNDTSQIRCDDSDASLRRFCPCVIVRHAISAPSSGTGTQLGICHNGAFHTGRGIGGMRTLMPAGAANAEACRHQVLQNCPQGNGATFAPMGQQCWCEVGMTGYDHVAGYQTCWFSDGVITSATGYFNKDMVSSKASLPLAAIGVAALLATAVLAFSWRMQGRGERLLVADDDEDA